MPSIKVYKGRQNNTRSTIDVLEPVVVKKRQDIQEEFRAFVHESPEVQYI